MQTSWFAAVGAAPATARLAGRPASTIGAATVCRATPPPARACARAMRSAPRCSPARTRASTAVASRRAPTPANAPHRRSAADPSRASDASDGGGGPSPGVTSDTTRGRLGHRRVRRPARGPRRALARKRTNARGLGVPDATLASVRLRGPARHSRSYDCSRLRAKRRSQCTSGRVPQDTTGSSTETRPEGCGIRHEHRRWRGHERRRRHVETRAGAMTAHQGPAARPSRAVTAWAHRSCSAWLVCSAVAAPRRRQNAHHGRATLPSP